MTKDALIILKDGRTSIGFNNFEDTTAAELLQVNGAIRHKGLVSTPTFVGSGNNTVTTADHIILKTAVTANDTITLPTIAPTGQIFTIKDAAGGAAANNITVVCASGETIDGASSKVLSTNYESFTIISDGTNYLIID